MGRNYERLSIEDFGRHLIETGDLDPVYIAMNRMEWRDDAHKYRWLIAYWCLYNCGAASWLSEQEGLNFWRYLHTAAENTIGPNKLGVAYLERWPRGSERRHWRGQQAISSCAEMAKRYGARPENMVEYISAPEVDPSSHGLPFHMVADRVKEHRGFGPWIAFKVGDMVDRLGIHPVNFANADVFMFKDPAKAAEMLFRQRSNLPETATVKRDVVIPKVVSYLESTFSDLTAPPLEERPVGLQEVETVLCKWKSHMNGHYPLYNDIKEIRESLTPWISHDTARRFFEAMPVVNPSKEQLHGHGV